MTEGTKPAPKKKNFRGVREPDPRRQIELFSRDITGILARVAPLCEVMRSAAKTEKEIARLVQHMLRERLDNMTIFVRQVASHGGLREGMDVPAAAELVWTITSPEVFLLLTRDRNYTKERYSAWLETTLTRLLLP